MEKIKMEININKKMIKNNFKNLIKINIIKIRIQIQINFL